MAKMIKKKKGKVNEWERGRKVTKLSGGGKLVQQRGNAITPSRIASFKGEVRIERDLSGRVGVGLYRLGEVGFPDGHKLLGFVTDVSDLAEESFVLFTIMPRTKTDIKEILGIKSSKEKGKTARKVGRMKKK